MRHKETATSGCSGAQPLETARHRRLIPSPSQTGTSEITVLWSDGEQQRMEISPDAAKLRIQRN